MPAYLLAAPPASAHEIYAKAGFPGAGIGYARSLDAHFGVRADFSSAGTLNHRGVARKSRYDADIKADHLGAYADWFPLGGGFRLSGGLHARTLEVIADSHVGTITARGIHIPFGGPNRIHAVQTRVRWPRIAPYLGIGWGHHADQGKGFGLMADLGVSFGAPGVELTINDPLRQKLDALGKVANVNIDTEIERQRRDLAADVDMVKMIPHLFVGVSYRY